MEERIYLFDKQQVYCDGSFLVYDAKRNCFDFAGATDGAVFKLLNGAIVHVEPIGSMKKPYYIKKEKK